jgi:Ion transport protein
VKTNLEKVSLGGVGFQHSRTKSKKDKDIFQFESSNLYGWSIIPAHSKFRTRWDILIIVFSLWICFTLPVQIAFEPDWLDGQANYVFNIISDMVYILDVLINFRTTIRNPLTNDEIFRGKDIAVQYLKGRFVLDLLASVPFDLILDDTRGEKLSV